MRCPICGSYDLIIHNSHAGANNTVRRYRKCNECGAAIKTIEVVEGIKTALDGSRYEKKERDEQ